MSDKPTLIQLFVSMQNELALLAFSGLSGAFLKAVFAPESETNRRIAQGVMGGFSALFLGGLAANIIDSTVGGGSFAYLACGFIMGTAGEVGVKLFQDRVLGEDKK